MREVIIEVIVKVLGAVLMGVVSVAFAAIGKWIAKTKKLESVSAAMDELERVVKAVVGDLQQTMVEGLKAAAEAGKLSKTDIEYLGQELICRTAEQLSVPAAQTLAAAGCDVEAMIHTIAESYISKIKRGEGLILAPEIVEA